MSPVTLIIVGAGQRGRVYADFAFKNSTVSTVVGVAEVRPMRRNRMIKEFNIPDEHAVEDWHDLVHLPKFADAAVICTLDRYHLEAIEAFSALGYHILCEKPMAVTIPECISIAHTVKDAGIIFGVGHVLRYSPYNRQIKEILDSGVIGEIVNINHIEPVGFEHFAHSYVRGNWGKEGDSTFSLMAKCCHDLDILNFYLSGKDGQDRKKNYPLSVSSFGSLFHFKPSNKPKEAKGANRCTECPYEPKCQFSAKKNYLDEFLRPDLVVRDTRAKHFVEAEKLNPESILPVLETSQFGECVYNGQNDVMDNQVVNVLYQSGATASMTMVAFTDSQTECDRITRIHGTKGMITGNNRTFDVFDFVTKTWSHHTPPIESKTHGGGDAGLSRAFASAVRSGDQWDLGVTMDDVLMSHLLVFAAETSRLEGKIINFPQFMKEADSSLASVIK